MSYILDALKRADAERGLTADAAITDTLPLPHAHRPSAPWWRSGTGALALAAALLGLAGMALLWWPQAKAPAPIATPEPTPEVAAAPVPPAVLQPAPIAPAAPPPATAPAMPGGAPPPETLNAATDSPGLPAPILLPERPVVARPAGAATDPAFGPDPVPPPPGVAARPPAPTPPPPAQAAAAPSAPVATTAPASAPPVKVTGATYSDNPAHRMLIVNGKIVLEGQDIEPGLKLEVITPHSAVLNHQGSRFNINY
jgi:general secretion pathway protein B